MCTAGWQIEFIARHAPPGPTQPDMSTVPTNGRTTNCDGGTGAMFAAGANNPAGGGGALNTPMASVKVSETGLTVTETAGPKLMFVTENSLFVVQPAHS